MEKKSIINKALEYIKNGNKRKKIINNINKICNEAKENGRFSLYMTKHFQDLMNNKDTSLKTLEYITTLIEPYDKKCNIPYEIGINIDRLNNDPNLSLGVHRTKIYFDDNNQSSALTDMMQNGLINYGHANAFGGSAFMKSAPSLTLTFTPLEGLTGYFNLVSNYHDNNAMILTCFPSLLVDKKFDKQDNSLYYVDDDTYRVKPEYMLGAFIKNEEGLNTFLSKSDILNMTVQRSK